MSNLDKANSVAHEWVESMGGLGAIRHDHDSDLSGLVQALEEAGLLMPSLPEINRPGFWEVDGLEINLVDKDGEVCIEWEADSDYIYGKQTRSLWLNRDQVLAILAAAKLAEEQE